MAKTRLGGRASMLVDRVAARVGVWALVRIFGRCDPPYDFDCPACLADRMCRMLEETDPSPTPYLADDKAAPEIPEPALPAAKPIWVPQPASEVFYHGFGAAVPSLIDAKVRDYIGSLYAAEEAEMVRMWSLWPAWASGPVQIRDQHGTLLGLGQRQELGEVGVILVRADPDKTPSFAPVQLSLHRPHA